MFTPFVPSASAVWLRLSLRASSSFSISKSLIRCCSTFSSGTTDLDLSATRWACCSRSPFSSWMRCLRTAFSSRRRMLACLTCSYSASFCSSQTVGSVRFGARFFGDPLRSSTSEGDMVPDVRSDNLPSSSIMRFLSAAHCAVIRLLWASSMPTFSRAWDRSRLRVLMVCCRDLILSLRSMTCRLLWSRESMVVVDASTADEPESEHSSALGWGRTYWNKPSLKSGMEALL
mmetsp:Transcript_73109/g.128820  ORF Transcript_73109/g.128820 Transcript_73109/m.128820 type:complete len:231 (-) Transcript_73109:340-1032(-)